MFSTLNYLKSPIGQYLAVTASYWAFTLTDGALRMLVLLYFHDLGYTPLQLASLFLLYELCGVITNLLGGWLAARTSLNTTLRLGLLLQITALLLLGFGADQLTVTFVMLIQALSGVAKDLNKMSAKSSIKQLVKEDQAQQLYTWVALLTGSKNTLKGVGFFLGGVLLAGLGFEGANFSMAAMLTLILLATLFILNTDTTSPSFRPKFKELWSSSTAINWLSAARLLLFGARDVWFVIALPVFLQSQLDWSHQSIGTLLAVWIILYGIVQAKAPALTRNVQGQPPSPDKAPLWAWLLSAATLMIAVTIWHFPSIDALLIISLLVFGALFAVNSALHSYWIVSLAREKGVSLDVGFYYMANACGRLIGTLLSGLIYQLWGLPACLFTAAIMIALAALCSYPLAKQVAKKQP